ncbi:MAG: hypothetical protein KatS3mg110_1352 [Pirellulaceae bacterium]|nr:MAG: hypothetical protein KatS3mg110_1352 [Pirellulaceae bacterium]
MYKVLRGPLWRCKRCIVFCCGLLTVASTCLLSDVRLWAQEEVQAQQEATGGMLPAGHSYHGEVFNEGPRQAALLLDGMGNVHFPVTTQNAMAQKYFDQGVAQLHGFWYFESERSFRQVAALDPDCAMAYWGMAMSNPGNEKRAKGFIAEAVKLKDKVTDRERRYIEALAAYLEAGEAKKQERTRAYTRALEGLLYAYPDDIEAKAFLALHLWNGRNAGEPIQSYLAVDALLDQVFAVNPMHPAHHYRIHLWDTVKPEKALQSAALCGPSLPGVAHMWHMPGHIYSRLKRYDDACYQQEASARVDHAHMIRFGLLPDQIHNFAHNNEWFIRNLVHVGRVKDALTLAKNMIELPHHPKYNLLSRSGCSASYGRQRLWDVLRTFEMWDEIVRLAETPYLDPTNIESEQIKRLANLGVAYVELQRAEEAAQVRAELQSRLDEKKRSAEEAAQQAKTKAQDEGLDAAKREKAVAAARQPFQPQIDQLEQALAELDAHRAAAAGDFARAVDLAAKAPTVDRMRIAYWMLRAGQVDQALDKARRTAQQNEQEVQPLAWYVYLLAEAERWDEVERHFEQLRTVAAEADLASAPLARLEPIAKRLGYPPDWRLPRAPKPDIGDRPPLESLGPFRWRPPKAEPWSLLDHIGKMHSLKNFSGRTVVVIFYLGYGCLHCTQQLQAFAPKVEEFRKHDIDLIAISTDKVADLKKGIENYQDGTFPITLVSNATLDVFKKYRCYDDFEQQPLHGTFVIDPDGYDIWHDISYEPFMDPDFVLQETLRQRRMRDYGATAPAPQASSAAQRAPATDRSVLSDAQ